jgi:tRNA(Ile)-lysidine synthase
MLLSRIVETVQRHLMFQPGQHLGVAVSGGADSVCLLHLLHELAAQWNLRLIVLHLNHGLRGEESCGDEQFVRALAARLQVPIAVQAVDVAASPDNLEQAARQARLEFFRQQMACADLARIAVGHTRNDQAETVLFRFLRGSGGAGLAGIRPVTDAGVVRPLLDVSRAEVEQYLRDRGILWREDSSNASLRFARNRIRHQLMPQLTREWNPAIGETLHRTAEWALAEEEYWAAEIGQLAAAHVWERDGGVLMRVESLRELPLAVARRLTRHALERTKGDLRAVDFGHIAAILKLASSPRGHGRLDVPGVHVTRSFNWLRFAPVGDAPTAGYGYKIAASLPSIVVLPGTGVALSLELIEKAGTLASVHTGETDCIDWPSLAGPLEIRNWRPGDRYQPNGSRSEEKIKTLFQRARIPLWERSGWPVITIGGAIVWVRQFGPAVRFAAEAGCAAQLKIREVHAPEREFGSEIG